MGSVCAYADHYARSGHKQRRRKEFPHRHCVMTRKCEMAVSQQTCFASGVVDNTMLVCRSFAAILSRQVCHDKIISRKNSACCKCACSLGFVENSTEVNNFGANDILSFILLLCYIFELPCSQEDKYNSTNSS
ncbi:hypothetical protein AVEN_228409-1 [Araneus ventricosus]|uniref:Uncharacterized protein n=1 Tax=Araneus ventricosus TaxID=182803 RepID=A0A4Y2SP42_ARAVE|nr:hypothetical protein AVEN_228409-1 [Araneus ventricosus]